MTFGWFFLTNSFCANAFMFCPTTCTQHNHAYCYQPLQSSRSDEPSENSSSTFEEDEQRRMALVRMIQANFYREQEEPKEEVDEAVGLWRELPIWRVPWVELPGRTNVLNVHEAYYTNMFEKLLRTSQKDEHYFGHVYMEKHTKFQKNPLCDWHHHTESSPCLGTLMRITDYQRLPNGRLLLLVQAMERFAVTEVHQNLPYGIANVQLLPDLDDTQERTQLLQQAQCWRSYEFEDTKFASRELVGSVLAQVLPYAAMDPTQIPTEAIMWPPTQQDTTVPKSTTNTNDTLEQQLLEKGILKRSDEPSKASTDELELQLWWAINDYLLTSKTPVSPILLGLLPPNVEWEPDFVLKDIGQKLQSSPYRHKYTPVCELYPKNLRQRRLSYHAAHLCKDQDRQELLAMGSTHMRLQTVLWKLETYNRSFQ